MVAVEAARSVVQLKGLISTTGISRPWRTSTWKSGEHGHGAYRAIRLWQSTVLRLMNRMHEVMGKTRVKGEVLLDGKDIYADDDVVSLRSRVGEIFKPNPFPKSIYDNVLMAPHPGRKSSDELDGIVEQALKQAALWKEVKTS